MAASRLLKIGTLLFSASLMAGFVAWRGGAFDRAIDAHFGSHNGGPVAQKKDSLPPALSAADIRAIVERDSVQRVLLYSSKSVTVSPKLWTVMRPKQKPKPKRTMLPGTKSIIATPRFQPPPVELKLSDSTLRRLRTEEAQRVRETKSKRQ